MVKDQNFIFSILDRKNELEVKRNVSIMGKESFESGKIKTKSQIILYIKYSPIKKDLILSLAFYKLLLQS
jgi:hypothetical protein